MTWSELESRLSDGRRRNVPPGAEGDSPAWTRKRQPYEPPPKLERSAVAHPYAELHCHSNFSFLDGASHAEELAEEAARLGLEALAITDHDGMYGIVRFAEAAAAMDLPTVFGAELSLGLPRPQNGTADPVGSHLLVLARDPGGYARLAREISRAQLRGRCKGRPVYEVSDLASAHDGRWAVLTGCRKGAVPHAVLAHGPAVARRRLRELIGWFGRKNVFVELWDHGDPLDSARNDVLVQLAASEGLDFVATNNVHYATPSRRPLATALAAVRARRSLDELEGWLPASASAHLRSGAEQARRFARYPGAVERAASLARECAFDLRLVAPRLPDWPVPPGHTEMSYLREITCQGALRRYGSRASNAKAYQQIDHELDMIEQLDYPGYFLIVWNIVEFCRRSNILCQGRGSAANSAVCYALGITNADAVELGLLFERFLSPERDGPPDIDIDIESDRREEAIQYVYKRYGRENAAQVANVITYRPRSSVRDMAKALGFATGQQDAWSKQIDHWGPLQSTLDHDIPAGVMELAHEVQNFPRHLGIHSGGMVICDRPVVEVCPVEWGRMENRTVLQWDKDDCAAVGLVKFDLLGLGMLTALHEAIDLVEAAHGVRTDLAALKQEACVYDMLQRADSVGVFQVESRAQMATLPRLRPRTFYDIVVEVALIRPGPIQGGSVHPYIRRRNGLEEITYLHPLLENALEKTLGVPLFQEQLMQIAIDVAGFTAAEADTLRQAMGSKRSHERMERLRERFFEGMAERGITGDVAVEIYEKVAAFANFGFPESHSVSFAYLVYASSWFKYHYPAAFCAALLNAQPMGFWAPNTLVADARRHGVLTLGPDVNASAAKATLEWTGDPVVHAEGRDPSIPQPAVRLGIEYVRGIGADLAKEIALHRPYKDMEDLERRCSLSLAQLESLATAGAFGCFDLSRREALWAAGAVSQSRPSRLDGIVTGRLAPALPDMTPVEMTASDLWATSVAPGSHPMEYVRDWLSSIGGVTASGLASVRNGSRVIVGGVVTHRQRPSTAQGVTFLNIEDETGLVNVICSKQVWALHRRVARAAPALLIRGKLERVDGVINLVAHEIEPLDIRAPAKSRDFR
jgi:error-prone DNA polymerase